MSEPITPKHQIPKVIVMEVIVVCQLDNHIHTSSNHYRMDHGWAIGMNTLEEFDQEGIKDILIIDLNTNLTYKATLLDFRDHGVPVPYSKNFLLCLPFQHWSVSVNQENFSTD